MKGGMDAGGCFPTGRHYPGIAHLIRVKVEGLADDWDPDLNVDDIPWVSIDTETTGREATEDRVIEVGCVFMRGGEVTGKKGWLIDPERPIPEDASKVHGLYDKDVAGQPKFREIVQEILDSMAGHLPLAYNADFDRKFLIEELKRTPDYASRSEASLPPAMRTGVQWIDPLDWARELQKEHRSRSLGDVCERLGVSLENAHRATDDAIAAGLVMGAFLKDERVPRPYGAFIKEQKRMKNQFEFERVRWR